jgi:hypothetical protein
LALDGDGAAHEFAELAADGRYGGTYAHKDIAFEFASWVSVEFKLYLIKEFQRLKDDENRRLSLAWNLSPSSTNHHQTIEGEPIMTFFLIHPSSFILSFPTIAQFVGEPPGSSP